MSSSIVQVAQCKCGGYVKLAVTSTSFDRPTTREFAKLMESGYVIKQTSIEDARTHEMCFGECGLMEDKTKAKKSKTV